MSCVKLESVRITALLTGVTKCEKKKKNSPNVAPKDRSHLCCAGAQTAKAGLVDGPCLESVRVALGGSGITVIVVDWSLVVGDWSFHPQLSLHRAAVKECMLLFCWACATLSYQQSYLILFYRGFF